METGARMTMSIAMAPSLCCLGSDVADENKRRTLVSCSFRSSSPDVTSKHSKWSPLLSRSPKTEKRREKARSAQNLLKPDYYRSGTEPSVVVTSPKHSPSGSPVSSKRDRPTRHLLASPKHLQTSLPSIFTGNKYKSLSSSELEARGSVEHTGSLNCIPSMQRKKCKCNSIYPIQSSDEQTDPRLILEGLAAEMLSYGWYMGPRYRNADGYRRQSSSMTMLSTIDDSCDPSRSNSLSVPQPEGKMTKSATLNESALSTYLNQPQQLADVDFMSCDSATSQPEPETMETMKKGNPFRRDDTIEGNIIWDCDEPSPTPTIVCRSLSGNVTTAAQSSADVKTYEISRRDSILRSGLEGSLEKPTSLLVPQLGHTKAKSESNLAEHSTKMGEARSERVEVSFGGIDFHKLDGMSLWKAFVKYAIKHAEFVLELPVMPKVLESTDVRLLYKRGRLVTLAADKVGHVCLAKEPSGAHMAVRLFWRKTCGVALDDVIKEAGGLEWLQQTRKVSGFLGMLNICHLLDTPTNMSTYLPLAIVTSYNAADDNIQTLRSAVVCHQLAMTDTGMEYLTIYDWLNICISVTETVELIHQSHVILFSLCPDTITVLKSRNRWSARLTNIGAAIYVGRMEDAASFPLDAHRVAQIQFRNDHVAPEVTSDSLCCYNTDVFHFGKVLSFLYRHLKLPVRALSLECTRTDPEKRLSMQTVRKRLHSIKTKLEKRYQ